MKKKKVFALLLAVGTIIGTMACGTEQAETTPPNDSTGVISNGASLPREAERAKEFITVTTGPTSRIYSPIDGAFDTALSE